MKAHGNGTPETCAANLLHLTCGEVPYDRVRGRDGGMIDQPNAEDDIAADAEWVLETYEPRVTVENIEVNPSDASSGDFSIDAEISRKEEDEDE